MEVRCRMGASVLVRAFTCSVCGGPRTTTGDALVVLCAYCGAVLTSSGAGAPWRDLAARHAEAVGDFLKPSATSARLTAISLQMHQPETLRDRALWRLLCEEQVLLSSIVRAGQALPRDPRARAEEVRRAVILAEIATFDPNAVAAMARYGEACASLGRSGDAVTAARAMLDGARAYYRAVEAHPTFPPGSLREGVEHHARELVRGALGGYATLLGEGTIERIRVDVLGDRARAGVDLRCGTCGGPLAAVSALHRCPRCGAVTEVDADDAWTSAQLGIWQVTLAELLRGDHLDGPTATISAIGGFLYTPASDVSAAKAVGFLRRAIPWVALEELTRGLDVLATAVSGDATKRALLDDVRALVERGWRCDPSARPQKPAPGAPHAPPTEAEEDAWVATTLSLWAHRRGTLMDLLGHPLGAMQVAAVYDRPTGCSARAARRFFEQAMPGFDRRAMHAQLARLAPGFDHPRVAAFIGELMRELGHPAP